MMGKGDALTAHVRLERSKTKDADQMVIPTPITGTKRSGTQS
jgi:hypothetical protein